MVSTLLNLDTSELDDFILKIHWLLWQLELIFSTFIIYEIESLILRLHILTKKDKIDFFSRLVGSEISPPSDELKRIGEKVVIDPFSEVQKSTFFRRVEFSANVFIKRFITISYVVFRVWFTFINKPVTKLTHDSNELTFFGDSELESSDSDNVTDIVDFGSGVWSFRVDDNSSEFVEFESGIGWLKSFVVETWIYDLELSNKVGTVVDFGRLGDVNDDTPT